MFKTIFLSKKTIQNKEAEQVVISLSHQSAKKRIRVLALCVFFLTFILSTSVLVVLEKTKFDRIQNDVVIMAQEQARLIQRQLTQSISTVHALAALVRQGKGDASGFESFAREFLPLYESISSIQLAKDAIVSNIYPLQGNEKAIGHDLLKDPKRAADATKTIETKKLTLSGPYQLIQGGMSVVARYPIFLGDFGQQTFWGFSIVVINMDTLLNATSLPRLAKDGYDCELYKASLNDQEQYVFYQNHDKSLNSPYTYLFTVPNGVWYIAMSPRAGWVNVGSIVVKAVLSFLFSIVLATLAFSFLYKPLYLEQIVENETHALNRANEELKKKTGELEEIAHIDHLTNVPNRRLFMETLQKAIEDHQNTPGNPFFSLLYLDIDLFKTINDQLGHQVGDEVLKRIISVLSDNLRKTDTIGRLGGDEFGVLLTDLNSEYEALKVAKKLSDLISTPFMVNEHKITPTVSIGLACYPTDGSNVNDLLRVADVRMYKEKKHKSKVSPIS